MLLSSNETTRGSRRHHTRPSSKNERARASTRKRAGGQTARPSRAKSPNSPAYVFRTCPTLGRLRSLVRSTTPRPRAGSPRGVTRAARDVGRCDVGPSVSRVVPHPRGGAAPRRGGRARAPRAGGEAAGVVRVQGVFERTPSGPPPRAASAVKTREETREGDVSARCAVAVRARPPPPGPPARARVDDTRTRASRAPSWRCARSCDASRRRSRAPPPRRRRSRGPSRPPRSRPQTSRLPTPSPGIRSVAVRREASRPRARRSPPPPPPRAGTPSARAPRERARRRRANVSARPRALRVRRQAAETRVANAGTRRER